MDQKPQVDSTTRSGVLNGWRWEAVIDKWQGGKYAIDSITLWDPQGTRQRPYLPREGSHDTLRGAEDEIERLLRDLVG